MTILANYETMRANWGSGGPDADGRASWPVTLVRANGFSSTITIREVGAVVNAIPITELPLYVNCTFDDDGVAGVDEYEWYVSQRTDDPALQWLSVESTDSMPASSYSGRIKLTYTQALLDYLKVANPDPEPLPLTIAQVAIIFKNVHIYARRVSDGAIKWLDALAWSTGPVIS